MKTLSLIALALATSVSLVHAHDKCGPEQTWSLAIPSKDWQGPPTVKMVAAGRIRCLAEQSHAEVVGADAPLPFGWGGPLPPAKMHFWPRVYVQPQWPE